MRPPRTPDQLLFERIKWVTEKLSWLPPVLQALAALGSGVLLVYGQTSEGDINWVPCIFGVLLGLASIGITILIDRWRRQSHRGETAERVQMQVTLNDAIIPILGELATMSGQDSNGRGRTLERVIGMVCSAVPAVLQAKRTRVVVFQLEENQGRRKRRLSPHHYVGRKDRAGQFVDGDGGRGDAVFAWLESARPRFVPDVRTEQLPGWQTGGKGYRTFISVPLLATGRAYGMISVDAPNPGDLDETDTAIIEVLASLLATAYAFRERA